jgi:hypothetical protein
MLLLKDMQANRPQTDMTLDELIKGLTDTLTERRASSETTFSEDDRFWSPRLMVSTRQPTA